MTNNKPNGLNLEIMELLSTIEILEKNPATSYRVRFQDCDILGHLNNSRYLDYFLNAREDHLEQFYKTDLNYFVSKGFAWVVSNHEIHYLKSALYNERITIRTTLIHHSNTELFLEYAMYDETQKVLKALMWSRLVCVDVRSGKKAEHNEEFTNFFSSLVEAEADYSAGIRSRLNMLKGK